MSRFSRRLLVASLLSLVCFSTTLSAADPWDGAPFSSDPAALLAAAQAVKARSKDEGVVVLLDEARYVFDAEGRTTRTDRLVFRVDDEASVEDWSAVEAPWSPWYQEKPRVDARVVTKDGMVHLLDQKSFQAADAEDESYMFNDTRVVQGPLPAVAAGCVVEQLITYKEKNPLYDAGMTQRHQFGRGVETEQTRLIIEYPAALPLRLVNRTKPEVKPTKTITNGVVRMVFESGVLVTPESYEWSLPFDVANFQYVAFSTGKSWQDVARRYSEIVDKQIAAAPVSNPASIGDEKDPRRIAAKILDSVERGIRYAGVEFGEGSIVPRTPGDTLTHKYGDCKDKATLLVAMLRQAGVPAHVALLDAGNGLDVERDLPGLGQFNHAIVRIDGAEPIWIDPTDDFARAGELPQQDQGRLALVASSTTSELTLTPVDPSSANRVVEKREFKLAESGNASIVETSEYYGNYERSMRREYAGSEVKEQRKQLDSYVTSAYAAEQVGQFEVSDPHDLSKPFTMKLDAKNAGRGITAGGEAAVGVFISRLVQEMPWDLKTPPEDENAERKPDAKPIHHRENDYVFFRPYTLELHYRIEPPPGYVLRAMPGAETLKLGTVTLTKAYAVEPDGVVLADYKFDSGPRRITAAQFEETRKAVSKLTGEEALLIYFDQMGRKYLDAGDIGKAIAEYRRLAESHPKEALHHDDAARALLAGGMGAAARREAKRGVEIEPKSAKAHQTLGFTLINDLIGREFGKGYDRAAAIAEYRKAKELDPKDTLIRAELAIVLARNPNGVAYGTGSSMPEAIAEYLAMKKEVKGNNDAIDRELMVLYARTGQFAELKKLAETTKDTEKKDFFRLLAVAALEGGPVAVKESEKLTLDKRRDAQATAASVLATFRRYPEAAELLSAAAQGSPNAAVLRVQADLLRKTKKHEDIVNGEDPEGLFRRFLIASVGDNMEKELKPLMTADALDVFEGDSTRQKSESAQRSERKVKTEMKKDDMAPFYLDLAIAALQLQKEGSDEIGYRLKARATGIGAAMPPISMFVSKEKERYRLAAVSLTPSMLALRALRFVEAGNLDGARQWLDWARDSVSGASEDPAASEPFAAMWVRGQVATLDEARLAAAVLLPDTKKSAELAIPLLTAAREKAGDDRKAVIDQALITAYHATENWKEQLAAAERVAAKYPTSAEAFRLVADALIRLDRGEEAEQRANARLTQIKGDATALRLLARRALAQGDNARAYDFFGKVLEAADAGGSDYNAHAWQALFANADLEKPIEEARQAVTLAPDSYASLNTLAVLYAEQGKSSEARDTLLKSMDVLGSEEPNDPDWYVVGRLAETYGVRDAAIEAYEHIHKSTQTGSTTWELARRRLAKLKSGQS